jgi:hypothetical protein
MSQLGGGERYALATWTKRLPMSGRTADAIVEAELRQNLPQVVDLQLGGESLSAPGAVRAFILRTGRLIQLDAELSRSLKNVEELSEWQKE